MRPFDQHVKQPITVCFVQCHVLGRGNVVTITNMDYFNNVHIITFLGLNCGSYVAMRISSKISQFVFLVCKTLGCILKTLCREL